MKNLPIQNIIYKTAFLCEGKNYYATFKPIIEALIKKETPFSYYTLDKDDPGLLIQSEHINAKYLGRGAMGYYKASNIEAEILVSTTPNIGNPRFPIKRPKQVKNLIHVFHSIADISVYKKGSLDFYDTVILVGDFQKKSIRIIEKLRGLKEKELISLGVPYIDELAKSWKENTSSVKNKTVLIGSSWGAKGCLVSYGSDFIKEIAYSGYNVIIRPHPQSFSSELKTIKKLKKELKDYSNIVWDEIISPVKAMNKADILISDTSSIRFDFAFIYKKPVISLNIKSEEMPGYERDDLDEIWSDEAEKHIGLVLDKNTIKDITKYIDKAIHNFDSSKICEFRNKTIDNFGNAGEAIAKYLISIP